MVAPSEPRLAAPSRISDDEPFVIGGTSRCHEDVVFDGDLWGEIDRTWSGAAPRRPRDHRGGIGAAAVDCVAERGDRLVPDRRRPPRAADGGDRGAPPDS